MREKEARIIMKKKCPHKDEDGEDGCGDQYEPMCFECKVITTMKMQARSYLEAIEKVKVLESFIHQIATWECCCFDGESNFEKESCSCGDMMTKIAWSVKAKWEEEK